METNNDWWLLCSPLCRGFEIWDPGLDISHLDRQIICRGYENLMFPESATLFEVCRKRHNSKKLRLCRFRYQVWASRFKGFSKRRNPQELGFDVSSIRSGLRYFRYQVLRAAPRSAQAAYNIEARLQLSKPRPIIKTL